MVVESSLSQESRSSQKRAGYRARNCVAAVLTLLFVTFTHTANATTLEILETSTSGGISIFSKLVGEGTTVVGSFLGIGVGGAIMNVGSTADTDAIVLSILFEGALDPAATVQIFLNSHEIESALTANSGALSIAATLMAGVNVFEFVFSNVNNGNITLVTSVTAVPLPAAAWLFLSALAGFGFISRRRKLYAVMPA